MTTSLKGAARIRGGQRSATDNNSGRHGPGLFVRFENAQGDGSGAQENDGIDCGIVALTFTAVGCGDDGTVSADALAERIQASFASDDHELPDSEAACLAAATLDTFDSGVIRAFMAAADNDIIDDAGEQLDDEERDAWHAATRRCFGF